MYAYSLVLLQTQHSSVICISISPTFAKFLLSNHVLPLWEELSKVRTNYGRRCLQFSRHCMHGISDAMCVSMRARTDIASLYFHIFIDLSLLVCSLPLWQQFNFVVSILCIQRTVECFILKRSGTVCFLL